MEIRTAVTVLYEGKFVPPGTLIDLPADEARAHVERFGLCPDDMTISAADLASVETLNLMNDLYRG